MDNREGNNRPRGLDLFKTLFIFTVVMMVLTSSQSLDYSTENERRSKASIQFIRDISPDFAEQIFEMVHYSDRAFMMDMSVIPDVERVKKIQCTMEFFHNNSILPDEVLRVRKLLISSLRLKYIDNEGEILFGFKFDQILIHKAEVNTLVLIGKVKKFLSTKTQCIR
jgi:hypothetical protein